MRKKSKKFLEVQSPRGMHDVLRDDLLLFDKINDVAESVAKYYGFKKIITPIVEQAELFKKPLGEISDVVKKEMFSVKGKSRKEKLVLRPEGTAPVARAYIEHGMNSWIQPVKLMYSGPMFRYERPQAGRFRQFFQFGLEVLGEKSAIVDVEVVLAMYKILEELKLGKINILVNSIGDNVCRKYYKKVLKLYYRNHLKKICADCKVRYKTNPLRLLDCKNPACQLFKEGAPSILEFLCKSCSEHFRYFLGLIEGLGLPYFTDKNIVRGFDYYTRTVFEFTLEEYPKDFAIASGGRYDGLVKLLGGADTPGVGVAMGIERVADILKQKGKVPNVPAPKVFFIHIGDSAQKHGFKIIEMLREEKITCAFSLTKEDLGNQLRQADKSGSPLALILGQQELMNESIIIRDMKTGIQETVPIKKLIENIKERARG